MTNYICINGNKTELTEEQLRQLGIELPKASPFAMERDKSYWFITSYGSLANTNMNTNREYRHNAANYCTDKSIMEQRALHETLNRLLWRYSMEKNGESSGTKYFISYNKFTKEIGVHEYTGALVAFGEIAFDTREIARNAIEEVINPFMATHPDFKF